MRDGARQRIFRSERAGIVPILCLAVLASLETASARVSVFPPMGDRMVVPRDVSVPVRGLAEPGEVVTVRFAGQEKKATAAGDGRWSVMLDPIPASADPRVMEVEGATNRLELKDALVGDVWLFAGQSNMAFPLARIWNAEKEISDVPGLRYFGVHFSAAREPKDRLEGGWQKCSPATAARMSAVAYVFGRDLQCAVGIPIGLLGTALSGSYAQVWADRETQLSRPETSAFVDAWDWACSQLRTERKPGEKSRYFDASRRPVLAEEFAARFRAWRTACAAARKSGGDLPPEFPAGFEHVGPVPFPDTAPLSVAAGFYSLISPLEEFPVKGAIWYQGESHLKPDEYGIILRQVITSWRDHLGGRNFPFLMVQLPNWGKPATQPVGGNWPLIREQQARVAAELPEVYFTVNTDTAIADGGDLHPARKQAVGARLAALAAAEVYGGDAPLRPAFSRVAVEGQTLRICFPPESGLRAEPLEIPGLAPDLFLSALRGFAVAGEDRKWRWASARIEGHDLVVSAPEVPKPVAARYNWADYPVGNLFGKDGLPVAPFRTDSWEN
jgi:sialate O-acetylesterase